jgi:hypothetical protein
MHSLPRAHPRPNIVLPVGNGQSHNGQGKKSPATRMRQQVAFVVTMVLSLFRSSKAHIKASEADKNVKAASFTNRQNSLSSDLFLERCGQ